MKQEFPGTLRLVVQSVRFQVLLNVAAEKPNFPVLHLRVRFSKRAAPLTQTLDLASDEYDTALERLKNFVIVPGFAVLADYPNIRIGILLLLLRRL